MKNIGKLFVIILLSTGMLGCPYYHMQTPDTVPPGKVSVGIGYLYYSYKEYWNPLPMMAFPGVWVRTGLGPNVDLGIHGNGIGLKGDVKFQILRYLAVGGGFLFGNYVTSFMGGSDMTVGLEGSVYAGYPGKVLYPYCVGRFTYLCKSYRQAYLITSVGGLRLRLWEKFSIYAEAGAMFDFSPRTVAVGDSSRIHHVFGLGFSFGY